MALDPRTPVLVGVGQVTVRPDPTVALDRRPEPFEVMARALRAAAEDCAGAPPGGTSTAGDRLLKRAQSLRVVGPLGWRVVNPGPVVAAKLGIDPAEHVLTNVGGTMPQSLLHQSALAVARGDLDVVLVTGAECWYTRAAARRRPDGPALRWTVQSAEGTPAPVMFGTDRAPATAFEEARGIRLPIHAYPLMENAIRSASGWTLEEHRDRIGALWSAFSRVAEANPYAWLPRAMTPAEVTEPGPDNRMVAFPYPKLCVANIQVDQGAAYICCSVEAARAAGVPEDRWVFPQAGADAHDHWHLSHRPALHRSPALGLTGRRALGLAGVGPGDLAAVDLYSCFPSVVQIAAEELGLPLDNPARPLTLTGGLTFGGGPGNNYVSHSIASMVHRLRGMPGAVGMTTGIGWYATKHAAGIYGTNPPAGGFRWEDVQPEVDALPRCPLDPDATGTVVVETYTVTYRHDGTPDLGIVACRTPGGARTWANVRDADDLAALVAFDPIGRQGRLEGSGTLSLR
jgi:acetyl-CoA C-acetyltransferase